MSVLAMNGISVHSARKAYVEPSDARAEALRLGFSYRSWRFS